MAASPSNSTIRSLLYRNAQRLVIYAGVMFLLVSAGFAQNSSKTKKLTGPRALGLLEITPSGGVTLLPVTIMIDGEFYDASAYKAAPVPLALYTDTVYEGVKTGVSQGLFTVTTAQQGENIWRGLGRWQSAADISATAAKKKAAEAKAAIPKVDTDGPPVLKRPGMNEPAPAVSTPATTSESNPDDPYSPPVLKKPATPAESTPTPATSTPTNPAPPTVTQAGTTATAVPAPAAQTPAPATTTPPATDPNLPSLRRGKAAAAKEEARETTSTPTAPVKVSKASPAGKTVNPPAPTAPDGIQFVPAISDAAGPEPRPYAYSMKPEEEAKFRNKMLALAAIEVRARAKALGQPTSAPTTAGAHSTRTAKPPEPTFDDVQLRVFDLSNNNEPILVLTANARLPRSAKNTAAPDLQYEMTLVAREDIYGDLHKAYSNVTDTQHLDILPRVDFIDAVDADGDGRGELLFRQVSDSGRAFSLYRVIGDQLWPLFQGKIG